MTFRCFHPGCPARGDDVEIEIDGLTGWPSCEQCGSRLRGVAPAAVFTGEISSRYVERTPSGRRLEDGGHWVWRVKSSKTGKPERAWISSWSEHRRYIREEGFRDPYEMPTYATISEDGRKIISISRRESEEIMEAIMRGEKLPVRKPAPEDPSVRASAVGIEHVVEKTETDGG